MSLDWHGVLSRSPTLTPFLISSEVCQASRYISASFRTQAPAEALRTKRLQLACSLEFPFIGRTVQRTRRGILSGSHRSLRRSARFIWTTERISASGWTSTAQSISLCWYGPTCVSRVWLRALSAGSSTAGDSAKQLKRFHCWS